MSLPITIAIVAVLSYAWLSIVVVFLDRDAKKVRAELDTTYRVLERMSDRVETLEIKVSNLSAFPPDFPLSPKRRRRTRRIPMTAEEPPKRQIEV
jgi:hypothetical protein